MNKTYSIALDGLRLLAAVLVFVHHSEQILQDRRLSFLASFGHDAVVFFFLLSGFVIAFVTQTREHDLKAFAIARLARLYSVVLPTIALVVVLALIGNAAQWRPYLENNASWPYALGSSLLLANQTWVMPASLPQNVSYWSVSYEACYYLLFGLMFYLKGPLRLVTVGAALLLAGPRIILLLPLWLGGVALYRCSAQRPSRRLAGYAMLLAAGAVYGWLRLRNVDDALDALLAERLGGEHAANTLLGYSKHFLSDYVKGAVFGTLLLGLHHVLPDFRTLIERVARPVRACAAYTFTLYLLHYPLLVFFAAMGCDTAASMGLTLAAIAIIGHVTERKKAALARAFGKLFLLLPRLNPFSSGRPAP